MTPASPAGSPTATRQRVSDEEVARDLAHARFWSMTVEDKFLMPAGYPADLRDSRASEAAKDAEIAELKRRLEEAERWKAWKVQHDKVAEIATEAQVRADAAEAKLTYAERAGMEREKTVLLQAAERAEKIAKMWGAKVGSSAMEVAAVLRDEAVIRAAMPPAKDEVRPAPTITR